MNSNECLQSKLNRDFHVNSERGLFSTLPTRVFFLNARITEWGNFSARLLDFLSGTLVHLRVSLQYCCLLERGNIVLHPKTQTKSSFHDRVCPKRITEISSTVTFTPNKKTETYFDKRFTTFISPNLRAKCAMKAILSPDFKEICSALPSTPLYQYKLSQ